MKTAGTKTARIHGLLDKLAEEANDFSETIYEQCEGVKLDAYMHYPSSISGYGDYNKLLNLISHLQDTSSELGSALYELREELGHVEKRQNRED